MCAHMKALSTARDSPCLTAVLIWVVAECLLARLFGQQCSLVGLAAQQAPVWLAVGRAVAAGHMLLGIACHL